MSKAKNGKEVVANFLVQYLEKRSVEGTLSCLTEDVSWIGTGRSEYVIGKKTLRNILEADILAVPTPFRYQMHAMTEIPLGACGVYIVGHVTVGDASGSFAVMEICVNFACRDEGEGFVICAVHASIGYQLQEDGTLFSVSCASEPLNKQLNQAKVQMENLVNSIPGGVAIYKVSDQFETIYFSDGIPALSGHSVAEYQELIHKDASEMIYPGDAERVIREVRAAISQDIEVDITFRKVHVNGSLVWVHLQGKKIGELDGYPLLHAVFYNISKETELYQEILDESDTAVFVCDTTTYEMYYANKMAFRMVGKDADDYNGKTCYAHMMGKDAPCGFCKVKNMCKSHMYEDELCISGLHRYYTVKGKIIDWRGKEAFIEYISDITDEKNSKLVMEQAHKKLLDSTVEITALYNNIPGAVFRCRFDKEWTVLSANDGLFKFLGYSREEFSTLFHNRLVDVLFPRDAAVMTQIISDQLRSGETTVENENRFICKDGSVKWISAKAELMTDENGEQFFLCVFVDITKQKELQTEIEESRQILTMAINHAHVQYWEFDMHSDVAYISNFSQGMFNIPDVMKNFPDCFLARGFVHPDHMEDYRRMHQELKDGACEIIREFKLRTNEEEQYVWTKVHYTNIFDESGKPVKAIATASSTEEYKRIEEQFVIAAIQTGVIVWTYDLKDRRSYHKWHASIHPELDREIENLPESLIEEGLIHPDDRDKFRAVYQKIHDGAKNASDLIRLKNMETGEYWWEKLDYTNIFDKDGNPHHAIGTGVDVTEQRLMEQRFQKELQYQNAVGSETLLAKIRANATQNVLESVMLNGNLLSVNDRFTYSEIVEQIAHHALTEEQRSEIRLMLNRKRMLKDFANGDTAYSLDYQNKTDDGKAIWVRITVKTYRNPETKDILCFMHFCDIDKEKRTECMLKETSMLIQQIVSQNYDYVADLDVDNNTYTIYSVNMADSVVLPLGTSYDAIAKDMVENTVLDTYREHVRKHLDLKHMIACLEQDENYSFEYKATSSDGSIRSKEMRAFFVDKASRHICLTRADVTELLEEEHCKNEILASALTAAKQASTAKSNFLSRMSHEIRTPMNAIIGMAAIAAQSIGNNEQVADCISKIESSSRFLLSLINDILDMSRIESGKMLLKSEEIRFKHFISDVNTICNVQAQAKGVDFDCMVDSNVGSCYQGDTMKLQQVLINMIFNAIKFTPAGGKVTLNVSQQKKTASGAMIRFVIEDTGCGMSEEFMPHLFEPFVQENGGSTSIYGGTGLGLAISKNIVDMMDGRIKVDSIKDQGTKFTVDVNLGSVGETKKQQQNDFANLSALVVDDDINTCKNAMQTLKEMEINAEYVTSGREAVERIQDKWFNQDRFDIMFIDWKMPEMDGMETAERIRKIIGPDGTIIIMTSLDCAPIETEVKQAGVNLLMYKPIRKSSVTSALTQALGKRVASREEAKPIVYDFTGKRVLLCEDHPLNTEVATMLLTNKGFLVETAENGARAVKLFSEADAGYYDAILMDIRMPIMDGLTAANKIRHLSKVNATSIPIIAMTANAFEDDIERSKDAGMNAHLAKPIEPEKLYGTLHYFIFMGECEKSRADQQNSL
ncbi:MAG: PAS domain-containing protein [Clostridia bacterium]